MKSLLPIVSACAVLLFGSFESGAETGQPRNIAGTWLGMLSPSAGVNLRIEFTITQEKEGGFSAIARSIDQGNAKIPVSAVTFTEDSLYVVMAAISGEYAGKILADGSTSEGTWSQGGMSLPLVMKRQEKPLELSRPQTPKKPYPYREEAVAYENKGAGVKLAGTLTIPEGTGPFPVALLLTGSGQQNRDEELFGHRPFLVLADYLTRRGIAVLRVDDRGVGGSTGNPAVSTTGDFADDALAGIEFLKSRAEIDPKCIGLVGHSEGGITAPIAAARSKDVAFIVMLAGPGRKHSDTILSQVLYKNQKLGADTETLNLIRTWTVNLFSAAENPDSATVEQNIRALYAALTPQEKMKLGLSDDIIERTIRVQLMPWQRYVLRHDFRATLMQVKCPVLALNGGKDTQVTPKENLAAVSEALAAGGNTRVTVREIPGLNHLFQTCTTGDPSEYATIEETMAPIVLETVSDWIRQTCAIGGATEKK